MKKILATVAVVAALTTSAVSAKVIGTVNGYKITEKEANQLLKVLTKGKVKYSQLKRQDKAEIVKRLAVDKLVIKTAYRSLSKKERDFVIANAWMAKKTRGIKVSTSEAKKAYNANKALFKKNGKLVPFSKVKNLVKMQLKQRKVVNRLMKKAKIVVK
jgi:opacity protein-like surface antigen